MKYKISHFYCLYFFTSKQISKKFHFGWGSHAFFVIFGRYRLLKFHKIFEWFEAQLYSIHPETTISNYLIWKFVESFLLGWNFVVGVEGGTKIFTFSETIFLLMLWTLNIEHSLRYNFYKNVFVNICI